MSASNGNVLTRSHFDPYGVETPIFGLRDQAISYQGYWSAPEFGSADLLSAGRLYLPALGSFVERDPVEAGLQDPVVFNAYLIGRSNPSRWRDPDGRCVGPLAIFAVPCAEVAGAVAVATVEVVVPTATRQVLKDVAIVGVAALATFGVQQFARGQHDYYSAMYQAQYADEIAAADDQARQLTAVPSGATILSTPIMGDIGPNHTGHDRPQVPQVTALPGRSTDPIITENLPFPIQEREPHILINVHHWINSRA